MSHRQSVSLFVALCLLAASTCTYFAFFEGDDSEVESSLQKGQTSAETVQAPSTDLVDQEAAPSPHDGLDAEEDPRGRAESAGGRGRGLGSAPTAESKTRPSRNTCVPCMLPLHACKHIACA